MLEQSPVPFDAYKPPPSNPTTLIHPWGKSELLAQNNGYRVKRIIIDPFQSLGPQTEQFSQGHWVVVEGAAVATVNEKQHILCENDHLNIASEAKHRISNPNHERLVIIETQTGLNLEEGDEIGFEYKSSRAENKI